MKTRLIDTLRIKAFLLILLAFALSTVKAQDVVRHFIQTGQQLKAKSVLTKEYKSGSITSERKYILGKILISENKQDSALLVFNSFDATKEEQRLLKLTGNALADLGKKSDAEIALPLLREIKAFNQSKVPLVKLEVAYVLARVNEREKAFELIEQACSLQPANEQTFVSAGDVYIRLSTELNDISLYGKACGRFEQALLVKKNYLPALTALAKAYINSRNFPEAKQKLKDALAIDSTWIPALQLMGELQYDLGNYKLASTYYGKYLQSIEPGTIQLQKYAYILYFDQQYAKAKEIINRLLQDDPENRVLLRLLAYTSCELKQPEEGYQAMIKFMNLQQKQKDSLNMLASDFSYYGRLLSMQSKDSLAIIQFNKAITLDSTVLSTYEYMAKSFEKLKRFGESSKAYNRLTKDPGCTTTVWFSYGRSLMLLSESLKQTADSITYINTLTEAAGSFSKVTELSPNSHLGHLWKGRAEAAMDPETEKALAEESYKKAIQLLETKNQPDKYKSELVEAYSYMGYLNYLRYEPALKKSPEEANLYKTSSLEYWNKILTLDPTNQAAVQATKSLK